jgi:DNA-binding transcriptional regulator YdaS (Cro superfamily)
LAAGGVAPAGGRSVPFQHRHQRHQIEGKKKVEYSLNSSSASAEIGAASNHSVAPRPRPLLLKRFVRFGKIRWAVRVLRGAQRRRVFLKSPYGTPEFESEYRAILAGSGAPGSIANEALCRAKAAAGNAATLAHKLGITRQALSQWEIVPITRVLDVEKLTGVPRHELRPDFHQPLAVRMAEAPPNISTASEVPIEDESAPAAEGEVVLPDGQAFSKLKPQSESEIFTKSADVKSGVNWTAERRKLLQEMWNRGDKAPVIAAALGCKVGAVNVARARFGLEPRRKVSGRPRVLDEPSHKIERVAVRTSRLMEFCREKELVAQTGHEAFLWPLVVVKELVDNCIDACEEAGVAPDIKVSVEEPKDGRGYRHDDGPIKIVIEDNGPGIPSETIAGVIDYNIRVSSREAYVSPTRGRQGNALKTILAMGFVLGDGKSNETWVEARGVKHTVEFSVNQIKQEPVVRDRQSPSEVTTGTRVTVWWPFNEKSRINSSEILKRINQFIWVNPHLLLSFTFNGQELSASKKATNPAWTKYRAYEATSAHWYTPEQFERYAGALIANDDKITVREFCAQFRGMSSTERQHQVLAEVGASHMRLKQFFGSETEVNHERMKRLLNLLAKCTRPVRPELLGVIGEDHLRSLCIEFGGEPKSFKYFASFNYLAGGRVPYSVEISTCLFKSWVDGKAKNLNRMLVTGVNFSATLENPFNTLRGMEGLNSMLAELRAGEYAPVIVCVHYCCPHIEYLDRGKSRIGLD